MVFYQSRRSAQPLTFVELRCEADSWYSCERDASSCHAISPNIAKASASQCGNFLANRMEQLVGYNLGGSECHVACRKSHT